MSICCLKKEFLLSEDIYFEIKDIHSNELFAKMGPKANVVKVAKEAAQTTATEILEVLSIAGSADDVFVEMIENSKAAIEIFIHSFFVDYSKGADKFVLSHVSSAPDKIVFLFDSVTKNSKPKSKELFSKLFKKC